MAKNRSKHIECGIDGCTKVFGTQQGLVAHRLRAKEHKGWGIKADGPMPKVAPTPPKPPDSETVQAIKAVLGSLIGQRTSLQAEMRRMLDVQADLAQIEYKIEVLSRTIEKLASPPPREPNAVPPHSQDTQFVS
jgi:hypothetical protein